MKGTCVFVASVVAASTAALTSTDRDVSCNPCGHKGKQATSDGAGKGKYAPRFDGLRFIETLVTAHR